MTEHSEKGKQGRGPNIKVVQQSLEFRQFFYFNLQVASFLLLLLFCCPVVVLFYYLELFGGIIVADHPHTQEVKKKKNWCHFHEHHFVNLARFLFP